MPLRDPNAPVRGTDNDAATSRLSAVQLGYFRDDFARHMVSRPQQRPPLINIGTHARTWAIDALVESFLAAQPETGASKQIISLGAGSDTRFFRLQKNCPSLWHRIRRYIELDFEESTARKIQVIKRHPEFHQALPDGFELGKGLEYAVMGMFGFTTTCTEQGGTALKSKAYHVLPVDLRSFLDDLAQKLLEGQDAILDPSIVTLLLLECVCIYISPQVTQPLLDWTARTFTSAAVVWYDPINLTDAFGRMMVNNLRVRSSFASLTTDSVGWLTSRVLAESTHRTARHRRNRSKEKTT